MRVPQKLTFVRLPDHPDRLQRLRHWDSRVEIPDQVVGEPDTTHDPAVERVWDSVVEKPEVKDLVLAAQEGLVFGFDAVRRGRCRRTCSG